jgi:hypothetical protein
VTHLPAKNKCVRTAAMSLLEKVQRKSMTFPVICFIIEMEYIRTYRKVSQKAYIMEYRNIKLAPIETKKKREKNGTRVLLV